MRWLAIFFSVYLLGLSVLPCRDKEDCNEKQQATITANHLHHNNEPERCSPFCMCSCCDQSITHIFYPTVLHTITFASAYQFLSYTYSSTPEVYFSIWQPPKIA
ncbi:MAG: hypothetical protein JST67_09075 [Bacteroidetes bacterium]|nr:hypothetical protein [Bacteroidota bacterium]